MPELKIDFKNLGTIRLMPLETSSLHLPFGRPIAEYLRGVAGNQNGTQVYLHQAAIDFTPLIRWTESTAWSLCTTGFGELEREGLAEPAVPGNADPAVADFLPMALVRPATPDAKPANISVPAETEGLPISKPRMDVLPLRPRMTFGPPPPSKVKPVSTPPPAPIPAPKPVVAPIAAKPAAVVAPPKPNPVPALKAVTPVKGANSPTPAPPKPVTVIPPPPRPSSATAPVQRAAPPQPPAPAAAAPALSPKPAETPSASAAPKPAAAPVNSKITMPPAARAPEPVPAPAPKPAVSQAPSQAPPQAKPGPVSAPPQPVLSTPQARAPESAVSAATIPVSAPTTKAAPAIAPANSAPAPAPAAKPAIPSVPTVSAGRAQAAPAPEAIARVEAPKPAPAPVLRPLAAERVLSPPVERPLSIEPHLTVAGGQEAGFFERIPMPLKIGVAMVILFVGVYFVFGRSGKGSEEAAPVSVGEQGWSTEQVSDTVGSRHGRQLTIYRPSVGMADYQLQFSGQIETKAIGWFFREMDTKNYYAMKIENLAPGKMAITHFAVIEGRESGYSQRPLGVDSRPGATYRVRVEITGPRFTVYVGDDPVDFWTDSRLKSGALGFMSERDERGATSSVKFSFPKGGK